MKYILYADNRVVHAIESEVVVEYPQYTTRPFNTAPPELWDDLITSPTSYSITSESPLTLAKDSEKTYDKHNNNGVG